jgi:hypothetical protein
VRCPAAHCRLVLVLAHSPKSPLENCRLEKCRRFRMEVCLSFLLEMHLNFLAGAYQSCRKW